MMFDMTLGRKEKQRDVPHVRKPLCIFAKYAMLDFIQIVTNSFTSRTNLIDILILSFYTIYEGIVCTLV